MQGDDLPTAPPPSPARRATTIGAALQRFDAAHGREADAAADKAPIRTRPHRIGRPQIGLLVSVALLVVIGLPTIRKIMEEPPFALERAAPAPMTAIEKQPARSPDSPSSPQAAAPPIATPGPEKAEATDKRARIPDKAEDVAQMAPSAPALMAEAPSPAAPPPPPVALPSMQAEREVRAAKRTENFTGASDIVVTAQRRSEPVPDRGDWNACTVNDPDRNLDACRKPIGREAKGDAAIPLTEGLALAWRGDEGGAIAAFDRAIALSPKLALAYLNRGLAYQRQGDLDRAIADLDKAARMRSASARIYYNRSLLLRERGQKNDLRRAKSDEQRAISLDPEYEVLLD